MSTKVERIRAAMERKTEELPLPAFLPEGRHYVRYQTEHWPEGATLLVFDPEGRAGMTTYFPEPPPAAEGYAIAVVEGEPGMVVDVEIPPPMTPATWRAEFVRRIGRGMP